MSHEIKSKHIFIGMLLVLMLGVVVQIPLFSGIAQEFQVQVDNTAPQLTYTGTTNNTDVEFETGGTFTAAWTVNESNPDWYILYWNQTGSNATYGSGSYTDGESLSGAYDPGYADVGNLIFFQLFVNDTLAHTNSSIVYFTVTNTAAPTVIINRPENATYSGGQIEVWLASNNVDLAVLWWALYYSNDTLLEGNVTWTETVSRTLSNGQYYLIGYCNDTAGLEDNETVYFTLAAGAIVGGSGGVGIQTTPLTDQVQIDLNPPTQIQFAGWLPQIIVGGVIVGGVYYVVEGYGRTMTPEQEFLELKRRANRNNIRLFYHQKEIEKKKQRRKK